MEHLKLFEDRVRSSDNAAFISPLSLNVPPAKMVRGLRIDIQKFNMLSELRDAYETN